MRMIINMVGCQLQIPGQCAHHRRGPALTWWRGEGNSQHAIAVRELPRRAPAPDWIGGVVTP
jgi:hypothetical protein